MSQANEPAFQQHAFPEKLAQWWKKVRTPHFMLLFATLFLIAFVVLTYFEANAGLLISMFFFSQVMVIFFAWVVIRHGVFDGKDFEEGQEFGYEDYDTEEGHFTRSTGKVMNQLKDSQ
ncbi:MAG: hypothetical protein LAT84_08330 [Balneolia bacterium]|nr:hypothetical protein [Balneolia bacterium]